MKNFNAVHNRLKEKSFESLENEELEKRGFVLYGNGKIKVLLKQLHKNLEIENIQLYSSQVRIILLENLINIQNAYLILCIDDDIDYEEFYLIERDNISLRKYVIRDDNDINRIPFLDDPEHNDKRRSGNKDKGIVTQEVKSIYTLLEQSDGKSTKLKDNQVKEIVNTLMQRMNFDNEY